VWFGEEEIAEAQPRRAVRTVVVALPLLVRDHVALDAELLLVERVEQVAHPVRLDPERCGELVRGHHLEVVGAVEAGGPVDAAGPMLSSTWNGEGCTCFEPENIMCSNRCANPLRPGV